MGKLLCIPCRGAAPMSDREVASRIRKIRALCPTNVATAARTRRGHPKRALRGLLEILRDCTRTQLQLAGPGDVIAIVVQLLYHFEDVRRRRRDGIECDFTRRRHSRMLRSCYTEILATFIPEKQRELILALVDVLHTERLWRWEDLSWDLARGFLERDAFRDSMIHALLDRAESATTEPDDARSIVRILCQILDVHAWPEGDDADRALERLLSLYRRSLGPERAGQVAPRASLKRGLELCVRRAIERLDAERLVVVVGLMCSWTLDDEATDAATLELGGVLECAARARISRRYAEVLGPETLGPLMRMLSSPSHVVSLLGNRVLQRLLDRRGNRARFDTPKIFYEATRVDLKLNDVSREDKRFLRDNRQQMHDSLVSSMINHCSRRANLEATYCTICLLAVEVPCGFTAAALVCLAMSLQDLTLERSELYREAAYHVHATVIAVMSLLCWIHDARVFYAYVNKIMMERAQWAPHLNPPLKSRYSFAVHHVLWDKPELFFVDWEARYGLWKCFRLRETAANERQRKERGKSERDENAVLRDRDDRQK